jgi:hypothetical protein
MSGNWIAVASAAHVRIGREGGFMQVCHGKAAPLRRLAPGDRVVYYSPSIEMGVPDGLQSFTAIGSVAAGQAYQADMGGGFLPFRRDVIWLAAHDAPIRPLLPMLALTAGRPGWGYALRYGLVAVSGDDMTLIAAAMGCVLPD